MSFSHTIKKLILVSFFFGSISMPFAAQAGFWGDLWKSATNYYEKKPIATIATVAAIATGLGLGIYGLYSWWNKPGKNNHQTPSPAKTKEKKKIIHSIATNNIGSSTKIGRSYSDPTHEHEDAYSVDENNMIFGVYDGNGKTKQLLIKEVAKINNCSEAAVERDIESRSSYKLIDQYDPAQVAQTLARNLPQLILNAQSDMGKIRAAFAQMQQTVRPHCMMGSGSTAVIAHIVNDTITIANIGDSRAVLFGKNMPKQLSKDHKPSQVFGAEEFDANIVHIMQHQISDDDEFLVLMSDGVYSAFTDNLIGDFIKKQLRQGFSAQTAAVNLLNLVRTEEEKRYYSELLSKDNDTAKIDDSTVIIIKLKEKMQ